MEEKKFNKEKFNSSPDYFKKIDWSLLRSQKTTLLENIQEMEKKNAEYYKESIDAFEGLLALIDAIQDYAVDEIGMPEMSIFDFEDEENRKG
jgi:hypothetical protein